MTKWVSSKLIKINFIWNLFFTHLQNSVASQNCTFFFILAQYEVGRLVPSELFYFLLAQYYKRKLTPKTCFKKLKVWQKKYVIQFLEMTWPKRLKVQKCQFYYWAMCGAAANWTVGLNNVKKVKYWLTFFVKPAFRWILDW